MMGRWAAIKLDPPEGHEIYARRLEAELFASVRNVGLTPISHPSRHVSNAHSDFFIRNQGVMLVEVPTVAVPIP